VRTLNKHVTNKLFMKFAGVSRTPFAVIRHVGRRSGRQYQTPIVVMPISGGFMAALTYGPEVDWYRNVLAAGRCEILWHGKEYAIDDITPVDRETGLAAFSFPFRPILRLVGIQDFVNMKYHAVGAARQTANT
jgi:deazaflavin-dependent oxidoreductase (nitroreductase family)